MDLSKVDTEGKFEHRMKPGIVHPAQVVCLAVGEIQRMLVANEGKKDELLGKLEKICDLAEATQKDDGETRAIVDTLVDEIKQLKTALELKVDKGV